jgi:hypothetical protein
MLQPSLPYIHFNIILSSTSRFPEWAFLQAFQPKLRHRMPHKIILPHVVKLNGRYTKHRTLAQITCVFGWHIGKGQFVLLDSTEYRNVIGHDAETGRRALLCPSQGRSRNLPNKDCGCTTRRWQLDAERRD